MLACIQYFVCDIILISILIKQYVIKSQISTYIQEWAAGNSKLEFPHIKHKTPAQDLENT